MSEEAPKIVLDPATGARRLDPVPRSEDLDRFYESAYYDCVRGGTRAPDLRRLAEGGVEAEREAAWLRATLHRDLLAILEEIGVGRKALLDVGCGTGDFLASAREAGWSATGTEPSEAAVAVARGRGLDVRAESLREHVASSEDRRGSVDVVTFLHVLEHLPDPCEALDAAREIVRDGGVIVVQVPNDFSEIQEAARRSLECDPWWIAVPDHVHYFDFSTLRRLLESRGWRVVREHTTFPMELFLLMGEDYVRDRALGSSCHARRRRFEMALPDGLRRRIYAALAAAGVGRDVVLFARKGAR